MTHTSHSPEETQQFAREEALRLTREGVSAPLVIALEGDLGAGKTTFTKAFAEALGVKEKIKSPTFVLMKHYHLKNVPGYQVLYHLDCYRLHNASELRAFNVEEIMGEPGAIVLIEWAERIKEILPRNHIQISIEHRAEQERNIHVTKIT